MPDENPAIKPAWLRVKSMGEGQWTGVRQTLVRYHLNTVCEEAQCPNKAECWGCGIATFMIMGAICTRSCRFCAVTSASQGEPLRQDEPQNLALAIASLQLTYTVLTSVDRDDLPDRGAAYFATCIQAVKTMNPDTKVEVLIPDYTETELDPVLLAGPDVVAHNVETVPRLQHIRDHRATFEKSCETLRLVKKAGNCHTKTSIMVGLGETQEEVLSTMEHLCSIGVDILVIGQYLQPTKKQIPVVQYIHPDIFEEYHQKGLAMGFKSVVAAPLARTSYHAHEYA